jgi:hypothetical protein
MNDNHEVESLRIDSTECGEYKFVIDKPYLDYCPEMPCGIYGPETPLPANTHAHLRVVYDRDRSRHEVIAILRELADHIERDIEFDVESARRVVSDPSFGTGCYHPGYERNMLALWEGIQHDRSR